MTLEQWREADRRATAHLTERHAREYAEILRVELREIAASRKGEES